MLKGLNMKQPLILDVKRLKPYARSKALAIIEYENNNVMVMVPKTRNSIIYAS